MVRLHPCLSWWRTYVVIDRLITERFCRGHIMYTSIMSWSESFLRCLQQEWFLPTIFGRILVPSSPRVTKHHPFHMWLPLKECLRPARVCWWMCIICHRRLWKWQTIREKIGKYRGAPLFRDVGDSFVVVNETFRCVLPSRFRIERSTREPCDMLPSSSDGGIGSKSIDEISQSCLCPGAVHVWILDLWLLVVSACIANFLNFLKKFHMK